MFNLGIYGGLLMENYMLSNSRETDFQKLSNALKTNTKLHEDVNQSLLARYAQGFWVDCLIKVHNVNQKCSLPLVYWMMLMEFRGLSRMGREICHRGRIGLPLRTYDENKQELISRYDNNLLNMLLRGDGIVAFDNFAKYFRASSLSTKRDTQYHLKNVTVVGVVSLQNTEKIIKEFVPLHDPRLSVLQLQKDIPLASLPKELIDLQIYQTQVPLIEQAEILIF